MTQLIQYKVVIFFMLIVLVASCTYEEIEPVTGLPENVSFQNDLIPVFNQSCNMVGCHSSGGIAPDLTPANAYINLMLDDDMIDTDTPENSELYKRMIDTKNPMPLTGILPYESSQVLSWITDGAEDN